MRTKARYDGLLMIDNRGGPGLPDDFLEQAAKLGFPRVDPGKNKLAELKTLTCAHCGTVQIENPDRVRPRGYCRGCDRYICDGCVQFAAAPGYVHRPWKQIVDEVRELNFRIENNYPSIPLTLRGTTHV